MARRPDGSLERDVMSVLWSADAPLLPAEVNARLGLGHAYTSVATVLTRLHAKGLVARSPAGRAFVYRAVVGESELAARRITDVLARSSDQSAVLARFVGGLSAGEARLLRELLEGDTR
jgi:predicted transcriptional regulator